MDQLALFVADSPARTCPLPETGRDLLESGLDYGSSLHELLTNLSRNGLLSKTSPVFYPATEGETLPSSFAGWQSAGMAWPGGCLTLSISESPSAAAVCLLSGVLETDVPHKYFLSPKACQGILRRAEKRGKALLELLLRLLQAVAGQSEPERAEDKAFQPRYFTRDNKTGGAPSDTVDITNAHKAGDSAPVLAFQSKASATNSLNPSEITPGLDVGKGDGLSVVGAFGVRRLTPTECERLQGFPDGWTKYRKFLFEDTEIEQADSARYRQLGNAVAVPVVEWIAKRIAQFRPTPFGADAEQQQATGDDEPAPLKPGR